VSQLSVQPDWVLLDGNHDYLTPPAEQPLFDAIDLDPDRWRCRVPVRTLIKGDLKCSSMAAASVLAKTERDRILIELAEHHPEYGFELNKAYSSPHHLAALAEHGPSAVHRRSWNLPGVGVVCGSVALAAARAAAGATLVPMGDDDRMIVAGDVG
jgi:ribonuclease HII